jgi:carbamoyltransferase
LSIDGSGDGYSTAVYRTRDGDIEFLCGAREEASLGKLYSNVTLGLGFKKLSDEGKVMGLAARGNAGACYDFFDGVIETENIDTLDFKPGFDLVGNSLARHIKSVLSRKHKREDICAAVQRKLENTVAEIVRHFAAKTGIRNIAISGGVASNILMNKRIRQLTEVDNLYIFPNMTDGGLSAGAALEVCRGLSGCAPSYKMENVFLGRDATSGNISKLIRREGLKAEFVKDMERAVSDLVLSGKIVARVSGRMEFGPRALGNRSVFALADRESTADELNGRLKRDEFMPFAPAILEEYAGRYLKSYSYSPYMAEAYEVNDDLRQKFAAVTHIDGTVRPQIVRKSVCPELWEIIKRIGDKTGLYIVLNTSYNMHGEPIVCSAEDAVNTLKKRPVDYLALGNYLLECP